MTKKDEKLHTCDFCGLIAVSNLKKSSYECRVDIYMLQNYNLLIQELMSMMIF